MSSSSPITALMLKSFELIRPYRNIRPFKLKFSPGLNIIVGENGSGKSTMLALIIKDAPVATDVAKICKLTVTPGTKYRFLDTERQNPRVQHRLPNDPKLFNFTVASHFCSHGESIMPLVRAIKSFKDELVLIDEPEAGISLSNQFKLAELFEQVAKHNQVVVTTHSYVLIRRVKKVYDLDSRLWTNSKSYLSKLEKKWTKTNGKSSKQ